MRLWIGGFVAVASFTSLPHFATADEKPDAAGLFGQLDANKDGQVTRDEVPVEKQGLFDRLIRRGDKDTNGQLNQDELAAGLNDDQPGQPEDRRDRGPGEGRRGRFGSGDGPPNPEEFFKRLDKNGDGKLTADEAPEEGKERFARMLEHQDKDGDKAISKEEFKEGARRMQERFGRGRGEFGAEGRRGEGRDGRPPRPEGDNRDEGRRPPGPPRDGDERRPDGPPRGDDDRRPPGPPRDDRGPDGPPGGRPDPEQVFKDMDKNSDGSVSKDEYLEFHRTMRERFPGRRGPGGPEGRRGRGPEGGSGDGPQGPPPERRNRPDNDDDADARPSYGPNFSGVIPRFVAHERSAEQRGEGRQDGARPAIGPIAIFRLLNADGDDKLSEAEINGAAEKLRSLDKDKDGNVTIREVFIFANPDRGDGRPGRPPGPPHAAGSPPGPPRGDRHGPPRPHGDGGGHREWHNFQPPQGGFGVRGPVDPAKMVERMTAQLDSNKDGKVSFDEFAAPHKKHFEAIDTNKDGSIDEAERKLAAEKLAVRMQRAQSRGQHHGPHHAGPPWHGPRGGGWKHKPAPDSKHHAGPHQWHGNKRHHGFDHHGSMKGPSHHQGHKHSGKGKSHRKGDCHHGKCHAHHKGHHGKGHGQADKGNSHKSKGHSHHKGHAHKKGHGHHGAHAQHGKGHCKGDCHHGKGHGHHGKKHGHKKGHGHHGQGSSKHKKHHAHGKGHGDHKRHGHDGCPMCREFHRHDHHGGPGPQGRGHAHGKGHGPRGDLHRNHGGPPHHGRPMGPGPRGGDRGHRPPGPPGSPHAGGPHREFNPANMLEKMAAALDANKDGKVSIEEFNAPHKKRFDEMDANKDGVIDEAERKQITEKIGERMRAWREHRPGHPPGPAQGPPGAPPKPAGPPQAEATGEPAEQVQT